MKIILVKKIFQNQKNMLQEAKKKKELKNGKIR